MPNEEITLAGQGRNLTNTFTPSHTPHTKSHSSHQVPMTLTRRNEEITLTGRVGIQEAKLVCKRSWVANSYPYPASVIDLVWGFFLWLEVFQLLVKEVINSTFLVNLFTPFHPKFYLYLPFQPTLKSSKDLIFTQHLTMICVMVVNCCIAFTLSSHKQRCSKQFQLRSHLVMRSGPQSSFSSLGQELPPAPLNSRNIDVCFFSEKPLRKSLEPFFPVLSWEE